MQVRGIDFTSRPRRSKPITMLECEFDGDALLPGTQRPLQSFAEFEGALREDGAWIAGIDLPFGQSRTFVENIGWPTDWSTYVAMIGELDRSEYKQLLEDYKRSRDAGDKEHRRKCDELASSVSPQKLYGVPVGLMFFEGSPRIAHSNVSVPGLKRGESSKIVVEAYPGVLVRNLIGRRSYKSDTRRKQTVAQREAREDILDLLASEGFRSLYGFRVDAPVSFADDPSGDELDALLCSIQAAWAWSNREQNFGLPDEFDSCEGWIHDPNLTA